ncbi:MAG: divalent-cation tolerance protein CutA [Coleofasciculaceae cyanobacterium RL_1_1]|nr:divalent-cation tolerance protein CutA [Coleofasciculaceae cyanobacterium RL_1_1]
MPETHEFIIVYVTSGSEAEAQTIAQTLVKAQLAGCVSLTPTTSVYRWDGAIQREPEWQLMIKTRREHWEAIAAAIAELHGYDVPECIAVPIVAGSSSYLRWLGESTEPRQDGDE